MYDAGLLHVFNLIERGTRFANSTSTHVVNLEDLYHGFEPERAVNEPDENDCVLENDEDDRDLDNGEDADCAQDSDE